MLNAQALTMAVQYGREEAVLKLLQLGADKTIKTKAGKSAAELASIYKWPQVIYRLCFPLEEIPCHCTPDTCFIS